MKRHLLLILTLIISMANGQVVDTMAIRSLLRHLITEQRDSNLLFTGTLLERDEGYDPHGKLTFLSYVSTYGGWYSDTNGPGGFQKFPTSAPRHGSIGLNMLMAGVRYVSPRFRSTVTLQAGDIPASAWSIQYNALQEANVGVRIVPKLWLDAGFFRTYLGLESIQPRENATISIATTTYIEPYFLSGAKLTWQVSPSVTIAGHLLNGFNTFVEDNADLAGGASISITASEHFTLAINTITSDETPAGLPHRHRRWYQDAFFIWKNGPWMIAGEGNAGIQMNSRLANPNAPAYIYSGILVIRRSFSDNRFAIYSRGEYVHDPDDILTGPLYNANHSLVGLQMTGITAGIEFRPIPNGYVRGETRFLHSRKDETIFRWGTNPGNQRLEILAGLGVWF